jgi:hypothetical protein
MANCAWGPASVEKIDGYRRPLRTRRTPEIVGLTSCDIVSGPGSTPPRIAREHARLLGKRFDGNLSSVAPAAPTEPDDLPVTALLDFSERRRYGSLAPRSSS